MIGVYGANGFMGRHLVRRLARDGFKVRAISRHFSENFLEEHLPGVEFVRADFRDPLAMAPTLEGVEVVVQLISTSSPGLQNRFNVTDLNENVIPHVSFLQSAVDAKVGRYIFLSSGGTIYGPSASTPIREDAPTNPISSHGLTKLIIEKYIQMHGMVDALDYVVLRVSNPFGPGQVFRKGQGLIPAVLARQAQGLPVQIIGDGGARRDYIYIGDLVDALLAAISRPEASRTIVNVGSGVGRSVLEVVDAIERALGRDLPREHLGSRKTDVDTNVLSIDRARTALGWFPKMDFDKGLALTVRAFTAQEMV